jgi:hypothetical protein
MLAMGLLAIVMFAGITVLALVAKVRIAENTCALVGFPGNCGTDPQRTVIAQLAASILGGDHAVPFFFIQATTALVLILAANTAFNGFPMLASILAQHSYLPRQLHNRGDRLSYSNGIILLASVAGALIWHYGGSVTRLIQLYILGVFTSFTLSQIGMVRHWSRALAAESDRAARRRIHRSQLINAVGAVLTALVLVIVLVTKFTHGAYLVVIAIPVIFAVMRAVRRHYDQVSVELEPEPVGMVLPARIHAVVLVSRLHKPALQALAFARATRPDSLTALTVATSAEETERLQSAWAQREIPVPLAVVESPYRELAGPVLGYLAEQRVQAPTDLFVVYIPEYVVGHWWEQLLHNQSALRLKARLLFQRRVLVVSVPWQLSSAPRPPGVSLAPRPPGVSLAPRPGVVTQSGVSSAPPPKAVETSHA